LKNSARQFTVINTDTDNSPVQRRIVAEQVEIQTKFDGYIKKHLVQVERFEKMENRRLSVELDYHQISGLSKEAQQKLQDMKPLSVGQASRISGVNPADISILMVYLEQQRRLKGASHGTE
jgi:tRNA uridine 5-carboxymethylaminomethyl modification enzyme